MRYSTSALALLTCLALGPVAHAQVVDQSQLLNDAKIAGFNQPDLAQSFQQAHDNISGAEIQLSATNTTPISVTISLYDNLPNNGGTLLTSGTDSTIASGDFATVFWNPVSITPNTTYYLVFTSPTGDAVITGSLNNPYSRGQVYASSGFQSFPSFDYTFQTFYTPAAVPEPGSVALLTGMTLSGAAFLRRRKAASKAA